MSDLAVQAKGRWRSILPALGVSAEHLSGRHGPCPMCAGKDRFRFDDKDGRGTFICSNCGAGDGAKLLMLVRGWTFPEAAREIEKVVGVSPAEPPKQGPSPKVVKQRMRDIWKQSHHLASVEATRLWWMNRVGRLPECPDLRGVEELHHAGVKRRFPGMIALVRDAENNVVNMHRTFLTSAGAKAPVDPARMVMPLDLPKGSAVRLAPYTDRLGIAEGIETAVAATILTGIPCWAALTANGVEGWIAPKGVAVTVFADNDRSYTGAAASYRLARRLTAQGFDVDVNIPSTRGEDWNDVLRVMRDLGAQPANTNTPSHPPAHGEQAA